MTFPELGFDRTIDRVLLKLVTREGRGWDVFLDLVTEPLLEVLADVVDASVSLLEVVRDHEAVAGRDLDLWVDELEDCVEHDPALPTDEAEEVLPPAYAVDESFRLARSYVVVLGHVHISS